MTSAATAAAALTVMETATAASEVDIEKGRKRRSKDKVVAKLKRAKLPTYILFAMMAKCPMTGQSLKLILKMRSVLIFGF